MTDALGDCGKILDQVEGIVREAGKILRDYHDRPDEIDWKGKDDPVTAADRALNAFLVAAIHEVFPDDGILAEESRDDRARLSCPRVWCVDPLDGTKEFIARNGEFCIMVGLAVKGAATLGVVYQPVLDILYSGIRSEGAKRASGGVEHPLRVSTTEEAERLNLLVSRSHRSLVLDRVKTVLGVARERASGSVGIKCGLIAGGEGDLYIHPGPGTKEWDTCAPEAILAGAGGRMTDCWGRPLSYNRPDVNRRTGIVASNGQCHDLVIRRIAPVLAEAGIDPAVGW
ncbi:MAG: 3'(2'),5'-bisphosphate nucleotidase CysQ [Deltaproteobacteria bacterium]|nr:3'(2'),5'-bisphosphate nucleotidase CysQ [Deltaproteobacteria bacterium]